mgnify:CR=1 FL=1
MTRKSSKNFIYGVAPATLTLSLSLNSTAQNKYELFITNNNYVKISN